MHEMHGCNLTSSFLVHPSDARMSTFTWVPSKFQENRLIVLKSWIMQAYCCLTLSSSRTRGRATSENVLPRVLRYPKRNFQKSHVQKDGALDEALFSVYKSNLTSTQQRLRDPASDRALNLSQMSHLLMISRNEYPRVKDSFKLDFPSTSPSTLCEDGQNPPTVGRFPALCPLGSFVPGFIAFSSSSLSLPPQSAIRIL